MSAPVAVVLMPRLPFPTASAALARRINLWPRNVIMLREDSLTLGVFGAALKALSAELIATGEAPPKDELLPVHGSVIGPQLRNSAMQSLASWELDTLRRIPLTAVEGIGAYRAILIHIGFPVRR